MKKLQLFTLMACALATPAFAQTAPKSAPKPMPPISPPTTTAPPAAVPVARAPDADAVCHVVGVLVHSDFEKAAESQKGKEKEDTLRIAGLIENSNEYYLGRMMARMTPEQAAPLIIDAVGYASRNQPKQGDMLFDCLKRKTALDKEVTDRIKAQAPPPAKK